MRPIDSLVEHVKRTGRKSPSPAGTFSPFLPPQSPPNSIYPQHPADAYDNLATTAEYLELGSTPLASELPHHPMRKNYAIEMDAGPSTLGAVQSRPTGQAQLDDYAGSQPVEASAFSVFSRTSWSRKSLNISSDSPHSTHSSSSTWSARPPPLQTSSTVPMHASGDTSRSSSSEMVSPLSDVDATAGYAASMMGNISVQPSFGDSLTTSPVEYCVLDNLGPAMVAKSSKTVEASVSNISTLSRESSGGFNWFEPVSGEHQSDTAEPASTVWFGSMRDLALSGPSISKTEHPGTAALSDKWKPGPIRRKPVAQKPMNWQSSASSEETLVSNDAYETGPEQSRAAQKALTGVESMNDCTVFLAATFTEATTPDSPCEHSGCTYKHRNTPKGDINYARHRKRKHSGDQSFHCTFPSCDKVYNRNDNLWKHKWQVHQISTEARLLKRSASELEDLVGNDALAKRARYENGTQFPPIYQLQRECGGAFVPSA